MKNKNLTAEFRKDKVSGEWVLISSVRRSRPQPSASGKAVEIKCPFDDPQKNGAPTPFLWYPRPASSKKQKSSSGFENWFVQIIPNKYPALFHNGTCAGESRHGVYKKIDGFGSHEVVITRDHNKSLKKMSVEEIGVVIKAYKERYKMLESDKCVEYVLIFHNEGELAGATIAHPHSQIIAMPIVPPDVARSIKGGINFFEKNKKCVHCVMIESEEKEKERMVFRNKYFTVFVPFASRVPYGVRIFPRVHSSDFENITEKEIPYLAEALKDSLSRLAKTLKNPDYNFFIHTSSAKVKNVPYYHWHIEILPRTYKWAGLELGTGIEVVSVPPEEAAEKLRKAL